MIEHLGNQDAEGRNLDKNVVELHKENSEEEAEEQAGPSSQDASNETW